MKKKVLFLLITFFVFSIFSGCKKEKEEEVTTGTLIVTATLEKDGNNIGPAEGISIDISGEDFFHNYTNSEGKVVFKELIPGFYSIDANFYDNNTQTNYYTHTNNFEIKKAEVREMDIVLQSNN